MPHPRMYDDGDPVLAGVRRVCLGLPDAVEVEAWGDPTFRAGPKGKMFAVFRRGVLVFKPEPGERDALLADPRFSVPPYYGPAGWLAVDLAGADWAEVAELATSSYRQVALKRQIAALGDA